MAGGVLSPRARYSSQTIGMEHASISVDDRTSCYSGVEAVVKSLLSDKTRKVSALTTALAQASGPYMTLRFAINGVITDEEWTRLKFNLRDMLPKTSIGQGLEDPCELTIQVDVMAGLDAARRKRLIRLREETEANREQNEINYYKRMVLYFAAFSVVLALAMLWMVTPSDSWFKPAIFFRLMRPSPAAAAATPPKVSL